jgi:hypothetical protein
MMRRRYVAFLRNNVLVNKYMFGTERAFTDIIQGHILFPDLIAGFFMFPKQTVLNNVYVVIEK